jgi:hypothetical protein
VNKALALLLLSFFAFTICGAGASSSGSGTVEITGPFKSCAIRGEPRGTSCGIGIGGMGVGS